MKPLASLIRAIDTTNENIGRVVAWVALTMVLVQFIVVVMRYVFGIGSIMMQESVVYMHAILFMVGAGYTLLHGGHVRVDVFYRDASPRRKALVDLAGGFVFLLPVCLLIVWSSWTYVASSWRVFEGSKETSGIQGVFLLKTVILVFAVLVMLQGVSLILKSLLTLYGTPPVDAGEDAGA